MAHPALITRLASWLRPRRATQQELANEQAEETLEARYRRLAPERRQTAREHWPLIVDTLADLGVCYRYRRREGERERIDKVKVERIKASPDAIYYKIDLRPGARPRGVGIEKLSDEATLKELGQAVGHRVQCYYSENAGFWYIEDTTGARGVPKHVTFSEMLKRRRDKDDRLSIPLGVGENHEVYWRSLAKMYHMLIAGTTGGGKSNFINAFICALLMRNKPHQLQLILVDLKGGVEFSFYRGLPHIYTIPKPKPTKKTSKLVEFATEDGDVIEAEQIDLPVDISDLDDSGPPTPALIERREHMPHVLKCVVKIGEERLEKLKRAHVKDVGEYNFKKPADRMSHLVLIIDEWADVHLDPGIGRECERLLANIASRFRAVGVHVILCTQVPNKKIISTNIKGVLPAKIAFSVPNPTISQLIVDDGGAAQLEPAGRAVYVWGGARQQIQTPFITNEMVDEIVKGALSGKLYTAQREEAEPATDVTPRQVFEWALEHIEGALDERTLYMQFKDRGLSGPALSEMLRQHEGAQVALSAGIYQVLPARFGGARTLAAVDDDAISENVLALPAPEEPAEDIRLTILEWALQYNGGALTYETLAREFAGRIPTGQLKSWLKELDDQLVMVLGQTYRVMRPQMGGRMQHPRHLRLEVSAEPAADGLPPAETALTAEIESAPASEGEPDREPQPEHSARAHLPADMRQAPEVW